MLVVGLLSVGLGIPGSFSLKDKRSVVKSVLEKSRHRFGVSSAEIGLLDDRDRSELAFACVSNEKRHAQSVMQKVLDFLGSFPEIDIYDYEIWCELGGGPESVE